MLWKIVGSRAGDSFSSQWSEVQLRLKRVLLACLLEGTAFWGRERSPPCLCLARQKIVKERLLFGRCHRERVRAACLFARSINGLS